MLHSEFLHGTVNTHGKTLIFAEGIQVAGNQFCYVFKLESSNASCIHNFVHQQILRTCSWTTFEAK